MHGAHKSRNVANGDKSGKYKNGNFTKDAKEKTQKTIVKLRYLEDLGQQGGFISLTVHGCFIILHLNNKKKKMFCFGINVCFS